MKKRISTASASRKRKDQDKATSGIGSIGDTRFLRGHCDKSKFSHDLNTLSKQSKNRGGPKGLVGKPFTDPGMGYYSLLI